MRYVSLTILTVLCLLLSGTDEASAQFFQLRLVSSANAWQRQDTVGQSSNHLFGYQTIQLSLAGEQLSFHTYMQGFADYAGPLKNQGTLRFYNFYLKYSNLLNMADVSLGRQAVFAGVGNGTIDGGLASVRLMDSKVKLLGYYGSLPMAGQRLELNDDPKNNNMYGAQIVGNPVDFARLSVSYMAKNIKPESYWALRKDSLFNPLVTEINPTATAEEYVSGDVSVDYDIVSAYARGDMDLNQEKLSRVQFFTRVKVMEPLSVTGEYIHREPRLSYNSIFWVFAYNTISEYELGAEYAICKDWQVFGKYGAVSYGDDNSNRVTLGGSMKYASASFSWNTGYGGELAALSVNAGYPLFNNKLTPTIMIGYANYKLSSNAPTTNALSAALGAVYRPVSALSLDAQVQWIQNKIYSNDVRLFLRGSYYLNEHLNIF
ncbi:MAG: hypothetical protein EHM64_02505 [Ignavibacteriae bacterium]|nr:MAG: hypothetical protein EHM64_02505 [Ignavibacteriota bacterium]